MDHIDFAKRLKYWRQHGNPEHGDFAGMGVGTTTAAVLKHPEYNTNPHKVITYDNNNELLPEYQAVLAQRSPNKKVNLENPINNCYI